MDLGIRDRMFIQAHIDTLRAILAASKRGTGDATRRIYAHRHEPTYTLGGDCAQGQGSLPDGVIGFEYSNISKLLKILENELKLIECERDPKDRRGVQYSLNQAGKRLLDAILRVGVSSKAELVSANETGSYLVGQKSNPS